MFKILGDFEDEKIFRNKAIDVLVNRIWNQHYPRIFFKVFCPYIAFCGCFLGYMIFFSSWKKILLLVKARV